jgi:hypothetical protein
VAEFKVRQEIDRHLPAKLPLAIAVPKATIEAILRVCLPGHRDLPLP